jgi:putative chitinase
MNTSNLATKMPSAASKYMLEVVERYNITEPLRLSHFLAQIAHESGNFQFVAENLNYSADSLLKVFPKYFKDKATADLYARKPEMIGSRVYANRMGNGDEASKEGFKFRGRGYIQLTGKDNYKAFSTFIGEDCVANPDLVSTKYPMDSAIWFFDKNKLWDICDKGAGDDIVTLVTKRVNGGSHGIQDRLSKFKTFNSLLLA